MELITSNPKSPACLLRGWARLVRAFPISIVGLGTRI